METNDICKILLNAAVYVPLFCALCTAVFAPFFGNKSSKALAVFSSGVSLFAAAVLWAVTQRTLPTRRLRVCDRSRIFRNRASRACPERGFRADVRARGDCGLCGGSLGGEV